MIANGTRCLTGTSGNGVDGAIMGRSGWVFLISAITARSVPIATVKYHLITLIES